MTEMSSPFLYCLNKQYSQISGLLFVNQRNHTIIWNAAVAKHGLCLSGDNLLH